MEGKENYFSGPAVGGEGDASESDASPPSTTLDNYSTRKKRQREDREGEGRDRKRGGHLLGDLCTAKIFRFFFKNIFFFWDIFDRCFLKVSAVVCIFLDYYTNIV